jgi:DNA repair ATPase RecN
VIEHIHVRNFQSLHDVSLDLAPFTVIVGPSSSGKSALTRALNTAIANRRGAAFISQGERTAAITLRTTHGSVTLTRGKGTSDNSYVVIPNDPSHPLAPQTTYSKLGGEVPVEVSAFLGIDPKDPLAFASQFDKPYLLDESAPEIARTLGALTNATVLLEGARESNRRKDAHKRTLTTRSADLEVIKAKVPGYRDLKAQVAALGEAEGAIERARSLSEAVDSLAGALEALEINAGRVRALRGAADFEIPSEADLMAAASAYAALKRSLTSYLEADKAAAATLANLNAANEELAQAEISYSEALGGLAEGFSAYMHEHGKSVDMKSPNYGESDADTITIAEAARLAAEYVEANLK